MREVIDIDLIPDCDPSKVMYGAFYSQPRRETVNAEKPQPRRKTKKERRNALAQSKT